MSSYQRISQHTDVFNHRANAASRNMGTATAFAIALAGFRA